MKIKKKKKKTTTKMKKKEKQNYKKRINQIINLKKSKILKMQLIQIMNIIFR